jgi:hypothetical protein
MNTLPHEVEMLIINEMSYKELKDYASTNLEKRSLVSSYLTPIVARARDVLKLGPALSKHGVIERLYHVNGYESGSLRGVTVRDGNWSGPKGTIILSTDGFTTSETWKVNRRLHRIDGPAIVTYSGTRLKEQLWYKDGRLIRIEGPSTLNLQRLHLGDLMVVD